MITVNTWLIFKVSGDEKRFTELSLHLHFILTN